MSKETNVVEDAVVVDDTTTENVDKSKKTKKNKKETPKKEQNIKASDEPSATDEESSLFYFFSQGCGWCKRVEPLIDELNNEGYNILKLDLAVGDNNSLQTEVKDKYGHQCGTPYFVDGETGNMICGFREKDVLEKWANGEEIPPPPRPTGPAPKAPFHGASDTDVKAWKEEYGKWAEDNKHLPNVPKADDILKRPRPKSDPPQRPQPNFTDEQYEAWGKEWDKWKDENNHLPNLQDSKTMVENFKQRFSQINNPEMNPNGPAPTAINANAAPNSAGLEARMNSLENKLDRLINHLGVK